MRPPRRARFLLAASAALLALPGLGSPTPARGDPAPPAPVVFTREVVEPLAVPNGHKPKALLDVDLDGFLDVIAYSNGLVWYEHPTWTAHAISPAGFGEDARAADIDGDGDIDFCFSGHNISPQCILNPLSQGIDPRTTTWELIPIGEVAGEGGHDLELADLDLDGRIDLVHLFGAFFQDPIGTWNPVSAAAIWPARGHKGTALGDIDGDGDLDLVTPSASAPYQLLWHENPLPDGDPRTDAWVSRPIGPAAESMASAVADLSGDGRPDVVASPLARPGNAANGLVWFEAPVDPKAPGATWIARSIDPTTGFVHQGSIHLEDMNGDGLRDVVLVEQEQSTSDRLAVYYNHGGGLAWTEHVIANVGGHNSKVGDIDGDGDIDVLNANHGNFGEPNPIEVFWNTGAPDLAAPVIAGLAVSAGEAFAALAWTTDEPASARVEVSKGGAQPRAFVRESFRERHLVVLTDLACATTYDLVVEARDGAGNAASLVPAPLTTAACGSDAGPVGEGLLALYELDEGGGTTVADTSGAETPLDLTILDPGAVTWLPGALRLDAPVVIASADPATKLVEAVSASGAVSIEAWLDPESSQASDAAILSIDGAGGAANLRFEQAPFSGSPLFRLKLRTQTSQTGGQPAVDGPYFAPSTELTHAVFTHGADGATRLYLDGVLVEDDGARHASPIAGWDPAFGLVLGNREGGGAPWLGVLHRVAVYGRALTGDEVRRAHAAGPGPTACSDGLDNDGDGAVDAADGGCTGPEDDSEREPGRPCDDGLDNDGDGVVDFPGDVGCESADASDENAAPLAADDLYRTPPGTPLGVSAASGVLANDLDSEGAPLAAELVTGTSHGALGLVADGSFDYSPEPGFEGVDTFAYTASDGAKSSGASTVYLAVAPENAPAALDDAYRLEPDESLVTDAASGVLSNDDDPQGLETLVALLASDSVHGALSLAPDGSFAYTPEPGYAGIDSFRYCADDGEALSNAAQVELRVAPVAAPPAGHWRFEEGAGPTAADSTGNGNDGVLAGPLWSGDTPFGQGTALDFDGTDDRVELGALDLPGEALTVAAFLKPDAFGVSDARIVSKATGTAESEHVWMLGLVRSGGADRLRFRLTAGGSTATLVADSGLAAGAWVHVAAVYDGSSLRLYRDGAPVGQLAKSGAIAASPAVGVAIGNQPAGAGERAFDGRIDDVRVYGAALTPAAIGAIASGLGAPFVLKGTAQGGTVTVVVEGVAIAVDTVAGQSAASVIEALAAAIDADATLAALGITARADGNELVTNGLVEESAIADPGFAAAPPPAPALSRAGAAALAALLAAAALRLGHRRRSRVECAPRPKWRCRRRDR